VGTPYWTRDFANALTRRLPLCPDPTFVALLFSTLFALSEAVTASTFKKYL